MKWLVLITVTTACFFACVSSYPQNTDICSQEQFRLHYHFSPRANWINDPNGLVYYNGIYHLFYQYHPFSTQWGPMHWGHSISTDLIHWEEVDIALYPDRLGYIFSGSAVVDFTNSSGFQTDSSIPPILAIYTNHHDQVGERQCIAFSNDEGRTFTKFEGNPVLSRPGNEDFRDPKVFRDRHTGAWTMILVAGTTIEFYGSENLKYWEKLSEFPWDLPTGEFECPDLVELPTEDGDETVWVLIVGVTGAGPNGPSGAMYFTGDWDGRTFTPHQWEPTQWWDWGPDNYAGVTWSNDPKNRTIAISWMTNSAYPGTLPTTTWHGQMTLPRQLSIHTLNATSKQYRVRSQPPEETNRLRLQATHVDSEIVLQPLTVISITPVDVAPRMEIQMRLEKSRQANFSICAHHAINSEEVCLELNGNEFILDRTRSGNILFNEQFAKSSIAKATRELDDNEIKLRIFLDTASIEVFADDGLTVMTSLFFPTEPLNQLSVYHKSSSESGESLKIKEYTIWLLDCPI